MAEKHAVTLTGSRQFEYSFTVNGTIEKLSNNGHLSAESSNDSITSNADGTVTVTGITGPGAVNDSDIRQWYLGDSYLVSGDLVSINTTATQQAQTGDIELFVDGVIATESEVKSIVTPTQDPTNGNDGSNGDDTTNGGDNTNGGTDSPTTGTKLPLKAIAVLAGGYLASR